MGGAPGPILSEKALARGNYQVGDKIPIKVSVPYADIFLETDFTIAGTYKYFPTVYEEGEERGKGQTAIIGNHGKFSHGPHSYWVYRPVSLY